MRLLRFGFKCGCFLSGCAFCFYAVLLDMLFSIHDVASQNLCLVIASIVERYEFLASIDGLTDFLLGELPKVGAAKDARCLSFQLHLAHGGGSIL